MTELWKAVLVQTASLLLAILILILLSRLTAKKGDCGCGCGGKKTPAQPGGAPAGRANSMTSLALADPGLAINF